MCRCSSERLCKRSSSCGGADLFQIYEVVKRGTKQIIYVGHTRTSLKLRFIRHHCCHGSSLFEIIKKEGKENFEMVCIDKAQSKREALQKEEFWTKFLFLRNSLMNKIFACRHQGKHNPMYGRKQTETAKEKISKATKGKSRNAGSNNPMYGMRGELCPHARSVVCITTGEKFVSLLEAAKKYGLTYSNISSCCAGRLKSSGKLNGEKLVWRYV